MPRFQPYTALGVRRMRCARCGQRPGYCQWNVCADKVGERTQYRVLCAECDVGLNEVAMRYVFGEGREADLVAYRAEVVG